GFDQCRRQPDDNSPEYRSRSSSARPPPGNYDWNKPRESHGALERRELDAPAGEEPVGGDEESIGPVAHEGGEGWFDIAAGAGAEDLNLQSEGTCGCRYVA